MTTHTPSAAAVDGEKRRLHLTGDRVLDLDARDLRTPSGQPVELRRKALDVLLLLAEQAGHVVAKETLMARVWPGVVVGDDSVTQTVVEIRRALGDATREVVCTVARRGYRLQVPQAAAEPAPGAAIPAFSIAVLPIAHPPDDPQAVRLAGTLTAELSARTGSDAVGSRVAARETAAAVAAAHPDPRDAARMLGVNQVVSGELCAAAGGWRLVLEVIDAKTGARRWSHRFALAGPDPTHVETVTARAARAILVEMHQAAADAAAASPAQLRQADDLALQGWAALYDGITPANVTRALGIFEEAAAKDASHLRALTGLCIAHWWAAMFDWAPDRREAQRRSVQFAARLEQLYPGETLTAMASCAAADIEGRWDLRLAIADRLCERDPSYPTAHFLRGFTLLKLGRHDECIAAMAHARRLVVEDFREGWWCAVEACAHLMAGRPGEAAVTAQQAIAANACMPLPPLLLPAALAAAGRIAEGQEALQRHLAREPRSNLARTEWLIGDGEASFRLQRTRILDILASLGLPRG